MKRRPRSSRNLCGLSIGFLIRPTKHDDEGYLLRHRRGVLPSNPLACPHAFTEDVRQRHVLGTIDLRVYLCDESVQAIPERSLASLAPSGSPL